MLAIRRLRPKASKSTAGEAFKLRGLHDGPKNRQSNPHGDSKWWLAGGAVTVAGLLSVDFYRKHTVYADATLSEAQIEPPKRVDLPVFKLSDVKQHGKDASRIWVVFKSGVYDITDFVEGHPGGDKILMAAGGSIEPFWALYAQHKTKEVLEILEGLRIGSLDPTEVVEVKIDASDPFASDPVRHPALLVNSQKPFNAETPPSLLLDNFITPNALFFVRNHLPVPQTDKKLHKLHVEGDGIKRSITLSVQDLKENYEPVAVVSVVQCAGNRRRDMQQYKKVAGLMWAGTAISNAKWTGVRLRDLLILAGVDPHDKNIKHVHLEGADIDPTGKPYGASITFEKAMNPDTIVAYAMNDEDIPRDHGAFSPAVGHGDDLKFDTVPSIQEYPVQSAICSPAPNATVDSDDEYIECAGYAWSGGGRGIIRVELTPDGGETWYSAELQQSPDQDLEHMWAWTLWKAQIPIPKDTKEILLAVKATDRSYNTQPETAAGIWNVRGLIHNAWHRVPIKIRD